jgi:uncharacterized protein (DUF3820 family)/ribonuclease HI
MSFLDTKSYISKLKIVNETKVKFGKYKGKPLLQLLQDASYVEWCCKHDIFQQYQIQIDDYLDFIPTIENRISKNKKIFNNSFITVPFKKQKTSQINQQSFTHVMYFDGCVKYMFGDEKQAIGGAGSCIIHNDKEIWCNSEIVFHDDNAIESLDIISKFKGLILGVRGAVSLGINNLLIKGDCWTTIQHIQKPWLIKCELVRKIFNQIKELEKNFDKVQYEHVYSRYNGRADHLCGIAILNHNKKFFC